MFPDLDSLHLDDCANCLRLMVGYIIAYLSFFPFFHRHCRVRERDPDALQPEARLYWLLWSESLV